MFSLLKKRGKDPNRRNTDPSFLVGYSPPGLHPGVLS